MKNNAEQIYSQPENTELTQLQSEGEFPVWLHGKLVRNGPALFKLENATMKHWFDGYGMIHGFVFQDGSVYYQSRYVESPEYLNSRASGKVSMVSWGTASDPCRSIFRRFMANFTANPTNTNVNIIKVGHKYYATSDVASLNEFDIESLETLSTYAPGKGGVMAAHPSFTNDGTTWNMFSKYGTKPKNTFVALSDTPSAKEYASFSPKQSYYFHSFGNTDRYLVSIEQPMVLNFPKLATSASRNKSFYECFEWDDTKNNSFHVFDRQTNTVHHIPSNERFFFFHTINSFEADNKLYIDLCAYKDNSIIDEFYLDNMATEGLHDENKATLRRLAIDLISHEVTSEDFSINIELPNINDERRNQSYRYCYGVHSPNGNRSLAGQIIKYDFKTKTHMIWGDPNRTMGEPLFVASPHAESEDDGVLLVLCHNEKSAKAELVTLNAKNLELLSTHQVPQSIPPSLHGWFYHVNQKITT